MSILFAGSDSTVSLCVFKGLVEQVPFAMVLTQQDRQAGRGQKVQLSKLASIAKSYNIPIYQPSLLGSVARAEISKYNPELLVCTAYGRILGPRFLSLFPRGAINMHPSLLPKYRGPSPLQATILNGDSSTGISIHYMTNEVDAGDILFQESVALREAKYADELAAMLGQQAITPMINIIDAIIKGEAKAYAQEEKNIVYCTLVHKEDGKIDWNMPASHIERMVRAYYPWPGVYASFRDTIIKFHTVSVLSQERCNELLHVEKTSGNMIPGTILGHAHKLGLLIQTKKDCLAVTKLQLPGRKVLDYKSFLNGVVDNITHTVLT